EYFVHVREVCGAGDEGPWSTTPLNFTTDCAAVTMFPATTDFTNNVPNACWSEAGSGEITDGPMNIGASDWRASRAYTNASGTVVPSNAINLWQNVDREWLISESYDLSSLTTKILTVEVAVTDYAFTGTSTAADTDVMGSDDSVDLLVTDDGGMTWTSIQTWNAANQPAVDGERVFIDLAAYSGIVQFAFLASDGTVDDMEDYDFHVGVFVVDATAGNGDVALQNAVSLYPNPVTGDTMTINLGTTPASQVGITIYNTLGQEVMTRSYNSVSNNTIVVENLSSLTTGVYLVNIATGDATAVKRFIKK
ncbi:T9SS type A sorting domain-containing protein, partial [Nonlabens sp.]|uniref:T9SS type A sorting domain-containing protein n=1 Tax=Nonlabens sp. TaxID=1888209 RepID=UPI003F69D52D